MQGKTFPSVSERHDFIQQAAQSAFNAAVEQLKADFGVDDDDLLDVSGVGIKGVAKEIANMSRAMGEACEVVPPAFLVTIEDGPSFTQLGLHSNNGATQHMSDTRIDATNKVTAIVDALLYRAEKSSEEVEYGISVSEGPEDALNGREGEYWYVSVKKSGVRA